MSNYITLSEEEKQKFREFKLKRRKEIPLPDPDDIYISLGDEYRFFNSLYVNRELTYYQLSIRPKRHDCSPECVIAQRIDEKEVFNPFTVPFCYGFFRVALKCREKVNIVYVTPCKKVLSSSLQVKLRCVFCVLI